MPQQYIYVPPELFLEHEGVRVYRTYQDDDPEKPDPYIFTTNPKRSNPEDVGCIDVSHVRSQQPPAYKGQGHRQAPTQAYTDAVKAWDMWFDVTEPALIREALINLLKGT